MSEKESNLTALVEASGLLRIMAAPERGKRALLKLSGKLPWSYRHIKAVWYCEDKTLVCADEMNQLRRAARLVKEEQEASNEVAQLRQRIARLESLLLVQDEDFHCETVTALRSRDVVGSRVDD